MVWVQKTKQRKNFNFKTQVGKKALKEEYYTQRKYYRHKLFYNYCYNEWLLVYIKNDINSRLK